MRCAFDGDIASWGVSHFIPQFPTVSQIDTSDPRSVVTESDIRRVGRRPNSKKMKKKIGVIRSARSQSPVARGSVGAEHLLRRAPEGVCPRYVDCETQVFSARFIDRERCLLSV